VYGYLLQDWLTVRGTQTGATIIQSEADWMSFQPYQDIVLWLEVKSVALGGLTSLLLEYQTAPAKDESLFVAMVTGATLTVALAAPRIDKVILAQNPTVPLSRWVRWKLTPVGTASSEYGLCFRIFASANAVAAL
jgi:hypothetical protein